MGDFIVQNGELKKTAGMVSLDEVLDVLSENGVKNKVVATKFNEMSDKLDSTTILQSEEITLTTDNNGNAKLADSRFKKTNVINVVSTQPNVYVCPLWGWGDSYYGIRAFWADDTPQTSTTIKVRVIYFANK